MIKSENIIRNVCENYEDAEKSGKRFYRAKLGRKMRH
jgi:hypothetical protein